jgi:ABC-type uncharacterized transport system substrate-binding protein
MAMTVTPVPRRKLSAKSGYYVKRILDGANLGHLQVERPAQVEMWINLKTVKALDIDPATRRSSDRIEK